MRAIVLFSGVLDSTVTDIAPGGACGTRGRIRRNNYVPVGPSGYSWFFRILPTLPGRTNVRLKKP